MTRGRGPSPMTSMLMHHVTKPLTIGCPAVLWLAGNAINQNKLVNKVSVVSRPTVSVHATAAHTLPIGRRRYRSFFLEPRRSDIRRRLGTLVRRRRYPRRDLTRQPHYVALASAGRWPDHILFGPCRPGQVTAGVSTKSDV